MPCPSPRSGPWDSDPITRSIAPDAAPASSPCAPPPSAPPRRGSACWSPPGDRRRACLPGPGCRMATLPNLAHAALLLDLQRAALAGLEGQVQSLKAESRDLAGAVSDGLISLAGGRQVGHANPRAPA